MSVFLFGCVIRVNSPMDKVWMSSLMALNEIVVPPVCWVHPETESAR